jgi:hypothetical protein
MTRRIVTAQLRIWPFLTGQIVTGSLVSKSLSRPRCAVLVAAERLVERLKVLGCFSIVGFRPTKSLNKKETGFGPVSCELKKSAREC